MWDSSRPTQDACFHTSYGGNLLDQLSLFGPNFLLFLLPSLDPLTSQRHLMSIKRGLITVNQHLGENILDPQQLQLGRLLDDGFLASNVGSGDIRVQRFCFGKFAELAPLWHILFFPYFYKSKGTLNLERDGIFERRTGKQRLEETGKRIFEEKRIFFQKREKKRKQIYEERNQRKRESQRACLLLSPATSRQHITFLRLKRFSSLVFLHIACFFTYCCSQAYSYLVTTGGIKTPRISISLINLCWFLVLFQDYLLHQINPYLSYHSVLQGRRRRRRNSPKHGHPWAMLALSQGS